MSKAFSFDDTHPLILTYDICTSIDNSYLTKRLSRLNPSFLFDVKPRTQSTKHRSKVSSEAKTKIIPELRAAVDILKTRLNSTSELKDLSRPCTRYRLGSSDAISPGKYYKSTSSTGGYEFSKSPRLDEAIIHNISSKDYLVLAVNKFQTSPGSFEKRNKKDAKNAKKNFKKIQEKNKTHNKKVHEVVKTWKIKNYLEMEQKKQELINKMENIKWKENREAIFKAKTKWSKILINLSVASIVYTKTRIKIVIPNQQKIKRLQKLFTFFQIIATVLGKFGKILRRKRKFLEYKNIRFLSKPLIDWMHHERINLSKTVSRNIWKIVNNNHLFLIMYTFKKIAIRIQYYIRRYLAIREARITVMTLMYNKLITNNGSKDSRRVNFPLTNFLGVINVPPSKKRMIVADYIKSYLHNHAKGNFEKRKKNLRLFLNKEAMISYFLIASNGLQNSVKGTKKNIEFFSHFKAE